MSGNDLRTLLDPLQALLDARPKWRVIPEQVVQPPPDEHGEDPPPFTVPERTELFTDATELPEVVGGDGATGLAGQVAMLHSALAWLWDRMELRHVHGHHVLTSGTFLSGQVREFAVTWRTVPAKRPTGALPRIEAGVAWLGRTVASIDPETITETGCTVRVEFTAAVAPTAGQPLAIEAAGTYFYVPPYAPETEPE